MNNHRRRLDSLSVVRAKCSTDECRSRKLPVPPDYLGKHKDIEKDGQKNEDDYLKPEWNAWKHYPGADKCRG